MATLSPRARRQDETAHERNARHILDLVERWGRAGGQRPYVPDEDETRRSTDGSHRVHVRSLTEVWTRGAKH